MTKGTAMHDVVVIGAGPAGLAMGACLKHVGLDPLILEREATVGSAWRRHYDRLCLQTRVITLRNILRAMGREDLIWTVLNDDRALERMAWQRSDALVDAEELREPADSPA